MSFGTPNESDADADEAGPITGVVGEKRKRAVVGRLGRRAGSGLQWLRGEERGQRGDRNQDQMLVEDMNLNGEDGGSGIEEHVGCENRDGTCWGDEDTDIIRNRAADWEMYRGKTWEEQKADEDRWREKVE